MTVTPHDAGDEAKLKELISRENDARQRDRYRAVLRSLDDPEGDEIARELQRSPRFVDKWLARYRKLGLAGLVPAKAKGRAPKLTAEQEEKLRKRLDGGPKDKDGVCTLRGKDICRIIREEFGVIHTLGGIYDVLARLGYSCLKPRPRHRKNDPAAMEQFKNQAPFFRRKLKEKHPGKKLLLVQDEARIGQQGTLTRVWARTGSRPTAIQQTEYQWVYLWAAVDVASGESAAMITPTVNTELMNQFLGGLSGMLKSDEHGVLVLDNAGWHVAKALVIPPNLTLLFLPPYSPELNPAERVWQYLRSHHLSNRVFQDYNDLLRQTTSAWDKLDAATLKTLCACSWAERAGQA